MAWTKKMPELIDYIKGQGDDAYIPSGTYTISEPLVLNQMRVTASPWAIIKPASNINMIELHPHGHWRGGRFDCTGLNFTKSVFTVNSTWGPFSIDNAPSVQEVYASTRRITNVGGGVGLQLISADTNSIIWPRFRDLTFYGFSDGLKMVSSGGVINACRMTGLILHSCVRNITLSASMTGKVNGNLIQAQIQPTQSDPITAYGLNIVPGCDYNQIDLFPWDSQKFVAFDIRDDGKNNVIAVNPVLRKK